MQQSRTQVLHALSALLPTFSPLTHSPFLTSPDTSWPVAKPVLRPAQPTLILPVPCSQHFPDKKHCAVPSGIDYLRLTPVDKLT